MVFIQGILGGIGGTLLVFAILLKWLSKVVAGSEALSGIGTVTYFIAGALLIISIITSVINTFTQKVFVHPDDKLIGNIFAFLLFMAIILSFGYFYDEHQKTSYDAGVIVLITSTFVYLVFIFGNIIGFHELLDNTTKREKEFVARFILFSILIGGVMVGLKFLFDYLYSAWGYSNGVLIVGFVTFGIIILIGVTTWKKYEPIGKNEDKS
ncbi:MAG: hypothetical protein ACTSVI_02860 [Promethearchaeota archaeon]